LHLIGESIGIVFAYDLQGDKPPLVGRPLDDRRHPKALVIELLEKVGHERSALVGSTKALTHEMVA
jgi:hypothetical protein